jgi:hypothetical protein
MLPNGINKLLFIKMKMLRNPAGIAITQTKHHIDMFDFTYKLTAFV